MDDNHRRALQCQPASLEARKQLAALQLRTGHPEQAAVLYGEVLSQTSNTDLVALVGVAEAFLALGEQATARQACEYALHLQPGHAPALQCLQRLAGTPAGPGSAQPLVSVVIPCFNQAQFLPEAVESVVAQTLTDWEVLVVNDGSPDATSAVCGQLAQRWPGRSIRCLEKPNGGLADARNAGIAAARGKYILPLDADDKLHPALLAKMVALLEAQPHLAIAYCDALHFGAARGRATSGCFSLANLAQRNLLNYCALFRREVWQAVGGYNRNMTWGYEDWDFWLGCAEHGFVAQRIPECLFFYRVKAESMLNQAREHDRELRARLVLNHPRVYTSETRAQAQAVLENMAPATP